MKALFLFAALALAGTANAQFTVTSMNGGTIPATGTGNPAGWDITIPYDDFDFTLTDPPGFDSVIVMDQVTCIDSVEVIGLSHTWTGDTHAVLRDPTGRGYNIWLRPGLTPGQSCCGNGEDLLGGNYVFVAPGSAGSMGPLPQAGDPPAGTYDQSWDTGAGTIWPDGDENVFNTPMDMISGPAGTWTLSIYDWAAQDTGDFLGWTLRGNSCGNPIGSSYCGPAIPNSSGQGAVITGFGNIAAASNNLRLTADQLPAGQFGYFLAGQQQGFFNPPGSSGFICLTGNIGRYNQVANIIQGPTGSIQTDLTAVPVNPPQPALAGETWNFQCWFRDNNPSLTSNFTDGLTITFQ